MAKDYHDYISRCQFLLQQGRSVADILYLTPEGSPHVFRAPSSAFEGSEFLPDRKGYNFDGCSPSQLLSAKVKDNLIIFPGDASYRLLVLPATRTMTPELLKKIEALVMDGATIAGNPPLKSPGLVNYPECDKQILEMAEKMWGSFEIPGKVTEREYGTGKIYWGGPLSKPDTTELYPDYIATSGLLKEMGIPEDFRSNGSVRYTHRTLDVAEVYFVSNRSDEQVITECSFREEGGIPELWDPLTGEKRLLPEFKQLWDQLVIPLKFEAFQSYFIVFNISDDIDSLKSNEMKNFREKEVAKELTGPWNVSFHTEWGGPENITFDKLKDWTEFDNEGVKYYSGIAAYRKKVTLSEEKFLKVRNKIYLDLGEVNIMARVRINGKELGVVWTAPWQVNITGALKKGENLLEIEVANLWSNRLIGDEKFPYDGIKDGKWPEWMLSGKPRTSGRVTFTTARFYKEDSPLMKSGLLGPVRILVEKATM